MQHEDENHTKDVGSRDSKTVLILFDGKVEGWDRCSLLYLLKYQFFCSFSDEKLPFIDFHMTLAAIGLRYKGIASKVRGVESASSCNREAITSSSVHFGSANCSQHSEPERNTNHFRSSPNFDAGLPDLCHCRMCGMILSNLVLLSQHMHLWHGQIERYVCPICGNTYRTSTGLRHHTQTHEGRVYPCKLCGAKFTRKGTMMRHLRALHNVSNRSANHIS
ncbi:Zinc finger protein 846 [Plakobranchus ocellatus]|uniref:Zinc finger protein 846 n=1 Tax=Plakobranchus ocellatus TaxID=259542 RepID=A0AAV3YC27_9GAST|nr:Zinc finger protein 846 [Plakobranchus ocellatus]